MKWKLPSPPVFPNDEDKTSRALALFQVQTALFALSVIVLPVSFLVPTLGITLTIITSSVTSTLLISYWLSQKGYLTVASYLTVITTIAAIIYLDYTGRGDARPLLIFSVIPIFVSGLLLGFRATMATAILMGISHALLVSMDMRDLYPFPKTTISPVQNMVLPGLGYVSAAFLLQFALRRIQNLLTRARANEQAARETNALLEEAQRELQDYVARLESTAHELQQQSEALTRQAQELEEANLTNRRRALQFQAVAEISRAITEIRDLDQLLPSITQTVSDKLGHYHTGIFLLDREGTYAVLAASNSEGGQRMLQRGHRLEVGKKGIVGYVAASGIARVALDVGQDAVFFDNPDLPKTRSEIALPLTAEGRIIGVLDVQSTAPNAFDQQDIEILSTLAAQIGAAIENARLFQETQKSLLEAQSLYRQFIQSGWSSLMRKRKLTGFRYDTIQVTPIEPIDPETAERIAKQKVVVETNGQTSKMTIPIVLRGEVLGVLDVEAPTGRAWSQDEVDIAQAVADRVALAAENARLFTQTAERAEQERMVSQITSKIRSTNDPNEMIAIAINELKQALSVKDVRILPYQPTQEEKG
ncbi:MAG: hypothetical protein DDG60_12045 [Anaerolineae bacterium]|nr:MAG: hypothetical protein DDG60_12045 [Anaerolineae bacterium]